ncbi:MAG: ribonuclease P protein component [Flavobacteriales bacterium]|jgi:ribonuclease P protein component
MKNTLCKEERLCSKILIDSLFLSKDKLKFTEYPWMVMAKEVELDSNYPAQVMISVSKRKIRLAVNRNKIKRKGKEAYRLNKSILYNSLEKRNKKMILCFIYLEKKPLPYAVLEQKIIVLLNRLTKE